MSRIVNWIAAVAAGLGAPGLFIIALLDSSILSLPEIADFLIISAVTQQKDRLVLYALSATAGSVVGCLALYYVGLWGGEAVMRKRFHGGSVDKTLAAFRRYGIMAVLIPSILPPPAPFKIFVLLAGIADIRVGHFAAAIVIGRGARYFAEGLLAYRYGDRAKAFLIDNGPAVSLAIVILLVAGVAGYVLWTKARQPGTR
jgi:membrane protein YqaA with SNARE-associated domain